MPHRAHRATMSVRGPTAARTRDLDGGGSDLAALEEEVRGTDCFAGSAGFLEAVGLQGAQCIVERVEVDHHDTSHVTLPCSRPHQCVDACRERTEPRTLLEASCRALDDLSDLPRVC